MKLLKPWTWPEGTFLLFVVAASAIVGVLAGLGLGLGLVFERVAPVALAAVAGAAPAAVLAVAVLGSDFLDWVYNRAGPWLRDNVMDRIR